MSTKVMLSYTDPAEREAFERHLGPYILARSKEHKTAGGRFYRVYYDLKGPENHSVTTVTNPRNADGKAPNPCNTHPNVV